MIFLYFIKKCATPILFKNIGVDEGLLGGEVQ